MRVYGNDWPPEFGAYYVYYDKDYADVCANSWIEWLIRQAPYAEILTVTNVWQLTVQGLTARACGDNL